MGHGIDNWKFSFGFKIELLRFLIFCNVEFIFIFLSLLKGSNHVTISIVPCG
jgi:hypothetical protein